MKLTYLYAKVWLEMKILLQNCKLNLSNSFHSRTLDTSILLWDQNLYEVVHTCLFLCTRQYYIKGTYFPTVMQVFYYQVIYLISGDLKQILPDRYNFSLNIFKEKNIFWKQITCTAVWIQIEFEPFVHYTLHKFNKEWCNTVLNYQFL